MFCSKCGKEIADGSRFCSFCGAEIAEEIKAAEPVTLQQTPVSAKPVYEDIEWNVNGYPGSDNVQKTEDIDFDWNADPNDIRDRYTRGLSMNEKAEINVRADLEVENITPVAEPPKQAPAAPVYEEMSPSEKVDKFYTFSRKNEEFQQLLNKEYDKIKSGNPIGQEQSAADITAAEKFEARPQNPSMEAFLEREGLNKIYQPKAVETDVLQRIEAQDRKREEERLAEEARMKILEEERLKAEAQKKAEEEARAAAEEEARRAAAEEEARRAEEEARERALEEARRKAEEEARIAEEEARIAEEEARIAAERQARIEAAEAARVAAEQETARLKAEAEEKARLEAEKIRQQQEARRAILEEEQRKIELERHKAEEEELRKRMLHEQQNMAMESDSAAAAEEARKALQQTARMKEEEQAKIRAAISGIKAGTNFVEPAVPVEPIAEPEVSAEPIAEPAVPAESMAVPEASEPVNQKLAEELDKNARAHQATQDNLSEMEKARREFLAEFGIDPIETKPEPVQESIQEPERHVPETIEELLGEKPVTGRDTMLSEGADMAATRVVDKSAVLAGIQDTIAFGGLEELEEALKETEEPAAQPAEEPAAQPAEEPAAQPAAQPAEEPAAQPLTVEDLLNQFESSNLSDAAPEAEAAAQEVEEGFAEKEEPALEPEEGSLNDVKPGLDNTMIMPVQDLESEIAASDFDSYGEQEAAMNEFFGEGTGAEAPQAAATEAPEEDYEEEPVKEKAGAGRVILKILLIILIIIFAVELAGIGIKFLAPNSAAAEFIDNQLNKVIHLITGSVTDYTVPGTDYEV